jgi:DNA-binding CsgD family transcriptional regulator/PAS domain-containing protein
MANQYKKIPARPREDHIATLDAVLDETSDIMLIVDKRLRIRESSRTAQTALGLPPAPDADRGLPLSDILSGEDDGSLVSALTSLESREGNQDIVSSFRQADGESLRVRIALRPLAKAGHVSGWALLVGRRFDASRDTGEPGRFGHLVGRVLRGYADPVFLIDAASRTIRACNDAAVAALGFQREELIGRSIDRFSETGKFYEEKGRASRFSYASSGVYQSKIGLRRKDKVVRSFIFTNVALFDDSGLLESILCILHDKSDEEACKAELFHLSGEIAAISKRLGVLTVAFASPGAVPCLSDHGLTNRQIEVVKLVASGSTTKAIAGELNLAEATVKSHLSLIYRKLLVNSRTELLHFIHEGGLRFE